MKSILIILHFESNTGYALASLEAVFYRTAMELFDRAQSKVHFAYPSMVRGPSTSLPTDFNQYLVLDCATNDPREWQRAQSYVEQNDIDCILGFDLPAGMPIYRSFRKGGVSRIFSYWGAPMSSINGLLTRVLKRLEVLLLRNGPDHYIFESNGMAKTAVLGRGISKSRTSVVPPGVDCTHFTPNEIDADFAHAALGIPVHRRLFFFSGHVEPRKGVAVIMEAANRLAETREQDDWHVVLCGNRDHEETRFLEMLSASARTRVTFGGYRTDLNRIHRSSYAAIIASTGWDSFTISSLEVQASGLPLLVSDLPGLSESIEHAHTGLLFRRGDSSQLAEHMIRLLDNQELRDRLSKHARERVERDFTVEIQVKRLVDVVRKFG